MSYEHRCGCFVGGKFTTYDRSEYYVNWVKLSPAEREKYMEKLAKEGYVYLGVGKIHSESCEGHPNEKHVFWRKRGEE